MFGIIFYLKRERESERSKMYLYQYDVCLEVDVVGKKFFLVKMNFEIKLLLY